MPEELTTNQRQPHYGEDLQDLGSNRFGGGAIASAYNQQTNDRRSGVMEMPSIKS